MSDKTLKERVEELLDEIYFQFMEVEESSEGLRDAYITEKDLVKNPWPEKEHETSIREFYDTFETNKAALLELVEEEDDD